MIAGIIELVKLTGKTKRVFTSPVVNEPLLETISAKFRADLTDAMNTGRLTIAKALGELSLGDRIELERWRDECREMLAEVAHG